MTPLEINPIKGFEAFKQFLSTLQPKDGSKEIWLKQGDEKFFVGNWDESGKLQINDTNLENRNDSESRVIKGDSHDAFEWLTQLSEQNDGGSFYIPTQPQNKPLAAYVTSTDEIGIEMDCGSREEQIDKYQRFTAKTELYPCSLISSGGKSIHGHFKLDQHYPIDLAQYIRRLTVIAFVSDAVTVNLHQPMRLPGFYRREKAQTQDLLFYGNHRYTPDQFVEGLRKWFKSMNWAFPETITEAWWRDCLRPLLKNSEEVPESARVERIREALFEGLEGYEQKKALEQAERQKRQEQRRFQLSQRDKGTPDWVALINEACDQLGADAFAWEGHNWQWNGNHARGGCPFHDSRSGTAGWIAPRHNGKPGWGFACPQCTDNRQMDAFSYWYKQEHGLNASYPKGKEYIEAVNGFLQEKGFSVPETTQSFGGYKGLVELSQDGISQSGDLVELVENSVNQSRNSITQSETVPLAKWFLQLQAIVGNRLKLNALTKDLEFDGKAYSIDQLEVEIALRLNGQFKYFPQIVTRLAEENSYSPVVEYLNRVSSEHGTGTEILDDFAQRYFGQNKPIYNTFIKKWLVSAVARAMKPGCKVDTVLILQGGQGRIKSTFFKLLASEEWFDDSLGDSSDKDERLKLHCNWIIEWAELEAIFGKKESAKVKAFLSSATDKVRPPYGRSVETMKRHCVIVGTTNEHEFLSDPTGNRRFWIIPVKKRIDPVKLAQERDAIWAAAVALYNQDVQWWLTPEEESEAEKLADNHQHSDPWQVQIENWLETQGDDRTSISDILLNCLGVELSRQDPGMNRRVSKILKQLKYEPLQNAVKYKGKKQRVWQKVTPEHLEHQNFVSVPDSVPGESPTVVDVDPSWNTWNTKNIEKNGSDTNNQCQEELENKSSYKNKNIKVLDDFGVPSVPELSNTDIARFSPGTLMEHVTLTKRSSQNKCSGLPFSWNFSSIQKGALVETPQGTGRFLSIEDDLCTVESLEPGSNYWYATFKPDEVTLVEGVGA